MASIAMEVFGASGLDYPRMTVTTDSPQVRMSLLATGRFLTIFPASVLRFSTQRLELRALPIELPVARLASGIFTLKNRAPSPVARRFIETAHEVANPLTKKIGRQ
jgi:DNA-binding transcriptional LysR family regulator